MNLSEIIDDFKLRWNITDDKLGFESFEKFRIRIINTFRSIDNYITPEGIRNFCNAVGIEQRWEWNSQTTWSENIIGALKNERDLVKLTFMIELIFSLPVNKESDFNKVDLILHEFQEAIKISNVNITVSKINGKTIVYPKGEELLNKELIEQVFSFINAESGKHFIEALKSYNKRTKEDFIKSSESIRRSLEEYLRYKLKNNKGLDGNISELGKQLKENSADSEIRNIILQNFKYLDKYFNENSKHNDGEIGEKEVEFLLYQTGLLMRYISQAV